LVLTHLTHSFQDSLKTTTTIQHYFSSRLQHVSPSHPPHKRRRACTAKAPKNVTTIKEKLGGLSTQRACTASFDFYVDPLYRGAYIGSTQQSRKLLLELSKLLSRKYESYARANDQYDASYHEEEKTCAPEGHGGKDPLWCAVEGTHPWCLP